MERRFRTLKFWGVGAVITLLTVCIGMFATAQVYAPYNQETQAIRQSMTLSNASANTSADTGVGSGLASGLVSGLASGLMSWEVAQQKVELARQSTYATGLPPTVDQPAWREALAQIVQFNQANPLDLDVLYIATTSYNEVGWDYMAWEYGRAYREAGGVLDDYLVELLTNVGNDLGYSYYESGNIDFAFSYYEAVSQLNPSDWVSVQEIGHIYSEIGFPEEAAAYWEEAQFRGSEQAQYFLQRSQLELLVGPDASFAYYHGLEHYEEGSLLEAKDAFAIAVTSAPEFAEAWRWLARTLLESCISQDALWAWQNYAALAPYDRSAAYFVDVAEEHSMWGCDAGQAYIDGLSFYEDGLVEDANQYFVYAASLDSNYLEAHRWAAITSQELGYSNVALEYWYVVQQLTPYDETVAYFVGVLEGRIDPEPIN